MATPLNAEGDLLGAPYHDGIVVGLCIRGDRFSLVIEATSAEVTTLEISGVADFGIHPLGRGAILGTIRAFDAARWDSLCISKGGPWDILTGGELFEEDLSHVRNSARDRHGDCWLFVFEFSFRGSIVVLGKDWDLTARAS